MTLKQEAIPYVPPQWKNRDVYKPVYRDTTLAFHEYVIDMQFPQPVTTHFEISPMRQITVSKRHVEDYDWITIILISGFMMLVFAKYNFSRRISQLLKACFLPRAVSHVYREGNPFNEQVTLVLGVIYLLSSSMFIYLLLNNFGLLPQDLISYKWLYAGILVINTLYWFAKTLAYRILAHIFKTYEATGNYLLNNLLFNLTLGVFFLIMLPLVVYTGSGIIFEIILVITAIMLVYKVFRGILVGLSITRFPFFYLILYICTLEVAPLLMIAKFFMT